MTFFSKNTLAVVKRLGRYTGCYQKTCFFQTVPPSMSTWLLDAPKRKKVIVTNCATKKGKNMPCWELNFIFHRSTGWSRKEYAFMET